MSGEKMAILRMLEEGKITAENAASLLAALGESSPEQKTGGVEERRDIGSQSKNASSSTRPPSGWATDLGKKIEIAAKELEPKIQKLAGVVVEKSVQLTDNVAKSVHSARERAAEKSARVDGVRANSEPVSMVSVKRMELPVSPGLPNEIILKSPSGRVTVKGYNGDKATLNISHKKRSSGKEIEFLQLGCVYQLEYDMDAYEEISMEVFLPFGMFRILTVNTEDGNVSVDNVEAESLTINTAKCHISVKNVTAQHLKIDNVNGNVLLSNSAGGELIVENAAGAVDATNTDFKSLKIETTTEPVSLVTQGFYKHIAYNWAVRTSNAKLKASLPVSSDVGYDLSAYTSLSDVSNGLSGIVYTRNDRNCIEGKSENYNMKAKKVRLELDTSNAPLYIN